MTYINITHFHTCMTNDPTKHFNLITVIASQTEVHSGKNQPIKMHLERNKVVIENV